MLHKAYDLGFKPIITLILMASSQSEKVRRAPGGGVRQPFEASTVAKDPSPTRPTENGRREKHTHAQYAK